MVGVSGGGGFPRSTPRPTTPHEDVFTPHDAAMAAVLPRLEDSMKVLMAYVFWRTPDLSNQGNSELLPIENALALAKSLLGEGKEVNLGMVTMEIRRLAEEEA